MWIYRKGLVPVAALVAAVLLIAGPACALADSASARQQTAEAILARAPDTTWIAQGRGRHIIYVFFDPNCPYCNQLYGDIQPWIGRAGLQVRWIPLGVLMADSEGKAAAILDAKDPLAAMRENEAGFSRAHGFGGILPELLPPEATLKKLQANAELLMRSGNVAVPTMVFRDTDGNAILIQGAPPARELEEIVHAVQ